jgi:hypothetical protein
MREVNLFTTADLETERRKVRGPFGSERRGPSHQSPLRRDQMRAAVSTFHCDQRWKIGAGKLNSFGPYHHRKDGHGSFLH